MVERANSIRNQTANLIFDQQNLGYFVPEFISFNNGHLNSHKLNTKTLTLFKVQPASDNQHKEILTKVGSEAWPFDSTIIAQTIKKFAATKPLEDR